MKRATMLFSTLLLVPAMLAASPPTPVRLKLSDEFVRTGDREKIHVQSANDGYLVVLRMDTQGNMRVIFPVDPTDDAFIRGDDEVEVRSRGDREAFVVNENQGSGLVLAAVSDQPFNFDAYSRGDHWDYRALEAANGSRDPEAAMLDMVDRMTGGHYDYDLVSYTVGDHYVNGPIYAGWYGPWYPSHYGVWVVGRPYHYFAPRVGFAISFRFGGPRYYDSHINRYYYMNGPRRYYVPLARPVGPRVEVRRQAPRVEERRRDEHNDHADRGGRSEHNDRVTVAPNNSGHNNSANDGARHSDRSEGRQPQRSGGRSDHSEGRRR